MPRFTLLTIAGFDPSSGAGITADLAVFAAHGAFGCSAVTAMTVQSTRGVWRVEPVDSALLRDTLTCLELDLPPVGIKLGMLATPEAVGVVCDYLEQVRAHRACVVVLDPVLRSSSGADLLSLEGLRLVRSRLLPLVDSVTPNRAELAALTGMQVGNATEVEAGARKLGGENGQLNIIVTGGDEDLPEDFVFTREGSGHWLRGERIDSRATHGTGCAFSSALLCGVISGATLPSAAEQAKRYVEGAIRHAPGLGAGNGPMDLLWSFRSR